MQWATHRGVVSVFVAAVTVSAVIGVSAAGGISPLGHRAAEEVVSDIETPTVTPTDEAVATPTSTSEATATMTPTETSVPEATGTPTPTATPGGDEENGQRDILGIPTANPSHIDEDGDGICEKGEVVIKETPKGNSIRVPCQAAEPNGHPEGHGNKHSTPSPVPSPVPSPTSTASP